MTWIIRRDGIPFINPYLTDGDSEFRYSDRQRDAMRFETRAAAVEELARCAEHLGDPRIVRLRPRKPNAQ